MFLFLHIFENGTAGAKKRIGRKQEIDSVKKLDDRASKNWTVSGKAFPDGIGCLAVTFLARRLLPFCHDEFAIND